MVPLALLNVNVTEPFAFPLALLRAQVTVVPTFTTIVDGHFTTVFGTPWAASRNRAQHDRAHARDKVMHAIVASVRWKASPHPGDVGLTIYDLARTGRCRISRSAARCASAGPISKLTSPSAAAPSSAPVSERRG